MGASPRAGSTDPPLEGRAAVLLAHDPRLADASRLAEALAPLHPHLSAIDVRTRCRYAAGVIEEHAPRAHAAAVVEALALAGIEARAIDAAGLPALHAPESALALDLDDDGLTARLRRAPAGAAGERIAWEDVRLVVPFALLRPFAKLADARAAPASAPSRGRQLLRALSPRLTLVEGGGARGQAAARHDLRRRADEAAALRADEDTPLGPDAERLQYGLARATTREGREPALGIDLVVAARSAGGGAPARVIRIERGAFAWRDAHAAHSLELLVYLGKRLVAGARAARALPEHALVQDGLLDVALFVHDEELARYERWALAAGAAGGGSESAAAEPAPNGRAPSEDAPSAPAGGLDAARADPAP